MGGTVYSSHSSRTREVQYQSMSREQVFKSRELNAYVDPLNIKVREARDSEVHPNTVPIIIAFDVTGSMGDIPYKMVQKHMSKMMETLIANNVPDATICFIAVGDQYSDTAPLQIGQFESGDIEIDKTLTSFWLEGGGGGQMMESYQYAWLFAARHTEIDSFIKRNKKGFLFTIGDEWVHDIIESRYLKRVLGYKESVDIKSTDLLKEAQEQWNVYHIHCTDGTYGSKVYDRWKQVLGEHCLIIDSSKIVDIIASTVAIANGADIESVKESLSTEVTDDIIPDFVK